MRHIDWVGAVFAASLLIGVIGALCLGFYVARNDHEAAMADYMCFGDT